MFESTSAPTTRLCARSCRHAFALLLVGIAGTSCADAHDQPRERAASIASALSGGAPDDNSPEANVVVAMDCTGTLITPRIALTAAHCIWGAETTECRSQATPSPVTVTRLGNMGSGAGPTFELDPRKKYASRIDHCVDTTLLGGDSKSQDIAVVYLKEPVTEWSVLAKGAGVAIPRIVRPSLIAPPEVDGHYPATIGAAGFGGANGPYRQVRLTVNGSFEVNDEGDDYQWEYNNDEGWETEGGDSGGPLFVVRPDGSRDVIGVLNGRGWDIVIGAHMVWPDITRGQNKSWLLDHVRESTIDPALRHSADWLTRHGKTGDSWWGELDYSGACDHVHDGDCDGWWDKNPDASHPIHDNCPLIPNPDQEAELAGGGRGDACRTCPLGAVDDPDGDGICTTMSWNNAPLDNCPRAANPDQANCNAQYELAERTRMASTAILGDACDPVPCPNAEAEPPATTSCLQGPMFFRDRRDGFAVRTIAPHITPGDPAIPVQGVPLANVPTKFRYCQDFIDDEVEVNCAESSVLQDSQLRELDTDVDLRKPNPGEPWTRVTIRRSSDSAFTNRQSNAGFSLTYSDGSYAGFVWDFTTDNAYWLRDGGNVVGSKPSGHEDCATSLFSIGTCLNGHLWAHAESPVGSTVSTVSAINVGLHGANLANHAFAAEPDKPVFVDGCEAPSFHACLMTPLACVASFMFRFSEEYCPQCGDSLIHRIADSRIRVPMVRGLNSGALLGMVWKEAAIPVESGMNVSHDVAVALEERHFVTAVETAMPTSGQVDAIALPDATHAYGAYLHAQVDSLELEDLGAGMRSTSTEKVAAPSLLSAPPPLTVYSRVMGGAFLLDGALVQYMPLHQSANAIGTLEDVPVAATLTNPSTPTAYYSGSAEPSYLWTVHIGSSGAVLSVREVTRDNVGATLLSATLDTADEADYVLATAWDAPDSALLTISNRQSGAWGVFEVGGFIDCVAQHSGVFDPSCLAIRPLYRRSDVRVPGNSAPGHLYQGVYAEPGAVVAVTVQPDDPNALPHRPRVDRRVRRPLNTVPSVLSSTVGQWLD